jgi:hypothetical protein
VGRAGGFRRSRRAHQAPVHVQGGFTGAARALRCRPHPRIAGPVPCSAGAADPNAQSRPRAPATRRARRVHQTPVHVLYRSFAGAARALRRPRSRLAGPAVRAFGSSLARRAAYERSTDVGGRSTIAYPPKTSRRTVVRSSRACSPFPVKLEPCMMASVLGFRSANFLRIPAVIGV